MIITRLKGGLGNQLFQYAIGRSLAFINNTELKLDTHTKGWAFNLHKFNITAEIASDEEIKRMTRFHPFDIFKPYYKRRSINQHREHFEKRILLAKDNVYLNGFWQSERYFRPAEDIIRKECILRETSEKYKRILDKMKNSESVSLHIRRTDYLNYTGPNSFPKLGDIYWRNALGLLKTKGSLDSIHLFIFSDDVKWVKNNLNLGAPTTIVSGEGFADYEELSLMSNCDHNIIANSTFSYWGAWLNNNPNKLVIYPLNWWSDIEKNEIYTKDLTPEEWVGL
ncbi:MAG: alpha-1,2-fucosyltransferase [Candidatus Vogelbacteria bacterium]|nr:alpha-1,2-fucosyltransferase [Candidatus Vogelbacteria bacterium]